MPFSRPCAAPRLPRRPLDALVEVLRLTRTRCRESRRAARRRANRPGRRRNRPAPTSPDRPLPILVLVRGAAVDVGMLLGHPAPLIGVRSSKEPLAVRAVREDDRCLSVPSGLKSHPEHQAVVDLDGRPSRSQSSQPLGARPRVRSTGNVPSSRRRPVLRADVFRPLGTDKHRHPHVRPVRQWLHFEISTPISGAGWPSSIRRHGRSTNKYQNWKWSIRRSGAGRLRLRPGRFRGAGRSPGLSHLVAREAKTLRVHRGAARQPWRAGKVGLNASRNYDEPVQPAAPAAA